MATKTRSAPRSAPRGASSEGNGNQPPLSFDQANEPNADILLSSLRSAGYGLESVIADLTDNSLDVDSTVIVVNIERDSRTNEWIVEVADNGSGMTLDVLDQMMRLGSRTEHDLATDLGAFGVGSDTAALAIGRHKHVVTTYEPGSWASSAWDLDVIVQQRRFLKHLGDATKEEMALFRAAFSRWNLETPETGTLVRITKCDRMGIKRLDPAIERLMKYLGQTYRRFLVPNGRVTMFLNGKQVGPIDPMWRTHEETQVLFEDRVDYTWTDDAGSDHTEQIGFYIVHLPDMGGQEANKNHGINLENAGFYVLRNGREIAAAQSFRMFQRHNEYSRFRAEINVPATLDAQLGLTFLKSTAEFHFSQSLRDKIREVVTPYRRISASLYKRSKKDADEKVPHEEAAKVIKSRAPFLRRPKTEVEKRAARTPTDDEDKPEREAQDPKHERTPKNEYQRALADVAEFEAKQLGLTAPFFEGSLRKRKVVVTYNADHPAYERLILENRDNRSQVTAIDFLVYSLVAAELRNVDDNNARFMEAMREDASFNLRQLLTT